MFNWLKNFGKCRKSSPALAGGLQSLDSGPIPGSLYLEHWGNLTHGLTPSRLRAILEAADMGDIVEQHQLFADMEDRCDHLAAEMGKRKRALLTLDWEILPSTENDKEAVRIAASVKEQFDSIPGFEDLLLDMADGIGHGFAAQEITWTMEGAQHLPTAFTYPRVLVHFVGVMALYHLTGGDALEAEPITRRYQEALAWLKGIAAGKSNLPGLPLAGEGAGGGVVFEPGKRDW